MRLTRIFVEAPLSAGSEITLPEGPAAHLTRVLRLGPGDACVLFDGRGGEYAATLLAASKREVRLAVGAHDPVEREAPLRVLLLQGLARGERMDFVVQKATELGVGALRPVLTRHGSVKLDPAQALRKLEHWRAIAAGACEQCRRNRLPELLEPLPLDVALTQVPPGPRLVLSLGEEATGAPALPRAFPPPAADEWITVLVGPEGGLAAGEEALACHAGFTPVGLGPRVLRTETAGPAMLAVLGALAGDLAG